MDEFEIPVLPNEQTVASRTNYPARDGEVVSITNLRLIIVATAWPGPSLFAFSAPLETCRLIEYKKPSSRLYVSIASIMTLTGITCFIVSLLLNFGWFVIIPFLFLFLVGFSMLVRRRSAEIHFHCKEETPLRWRINSGNNPAPGEVVPKIQHLAKESGIEISNFPEV